MAETISFKGQSGLSAAITAIDNVRHMLLSSEVTPLQAASFLGCINLHLAHIVGLGGDRLEQLESCGGLLCPKCQAYVGFVSDLSGTCFNCGEPFFAATVE
jgi:hypothetical protein